MAQQSYYIYVAQYLFYDPCFENPLVLLSLRFIFDAGD